MVVVVREGRAGDGVGRTGGSRISEAPRRPTRRDHGVPVTVIYITGSKKAEQAEQSRPTEQADRNRTERCRS